MHSRRPRARANAHERTSHTFVGDDGTRVTNEIVIISSAGDRASRERPAQERQGQKGQKGGGEDADRLRREIPRRPRVSALARVRHVVTPRVAQPYGEIRLKSRRCLVNGGRTAAILTVLTPHSRRRPPIGPANLTGPQGRASSLLPPPPSLPRCAPTFKSVLRADLKVAAHQKKCKRTGRERNDARLGNRVDSLAIYIFLRVSLHSRLPRGIFFFLPDTGTDVCTRFSERESACDFSSSFSKV